MSTNEETLDGSFKELGLKAEILKAIDDAGYETPTPIQLKTIPALMSGRDLIGQAQTGTGKTAAFAIPVLESLDLTINRVQALVLAPTRELALQVADAFRAYSKHMSPVRVLPVYGGQPIFRQMERLQAGVHIVVGTPGRVMDHLRRGTLKFDHLKMVVLDEADEMLRMGFLEDVEWILAQATGELQKALFSATMPAEIRRIADRYLTNAATIEIEHKTLTVPTTDQRYINVSEQNKLDTLTRILEAEQAMATIIFAHTKISTAELADRLQARGFTAEAMHGDMTQAQREVVIKRLRGGQAEIVVATDVAARGLDVEHISHVINFDIPYDPESYVHRIGRTGRAGREGTAITFVTPRQQRLLRDIERFTGQRIQPMKTPSQADVASRRKEMFKEDIRHAINQEDLELYLSLVEELVEEGLEIAEIAAAAAKLARGDKPLQTVVDKIKEIETDDLVKLYIDVGHRNNVRPQDIVGAIANEADIPGHAIGHIEIYDRFTFVELPKRFKDQVLDRMKQTKIRNRPVKIRAARFDNEFDEIASQTENSFAPPPREQREFRETRDFRETRKPRETREAREQRPAKPPKEPVETRDFGELRDFTRATAVVKPEKVKPREESPAPATAAEKKRNKAVLELRKVGPKRRDQTTTKSAKPKSNRSAATPFKGGKNKNSNTTTRSGRPKSKKR